MATQIGQYRFSSVNSCVTPMSASKSYKQTSYSMSEDDSESYFKDIQVSVGDPFRRGQDYYIYMKIPQDENYDLTFNVKLVKELSSATQEVYQFLKQVKIQKGGSGATAYRVALYEDTDKIIKAMIPKAYVPGVPGVKDELYRDELTNKYYLCYGGTDYRQTGNYNDLFVNASWIHAEGDQFAYVEVGFRPVDDGFSRIVLEMVRSAEDYNIQNFMDGQIGYGRVVNIDHFEFSLYQVTNLVNIINPEGALERIGIQGKPGLLTMVNGEEIRVGPSAAYELDVIPTTSLGVVATQPTDLFTIDYSYETVE